MSILPISRRNRGALSSTPKPVLALLLASVLIAAAGTAMPMPAFALGSVSPLDAWPGTPQMTATTGNLAGTFSVSDGTDRLLVVLVCSYDSGGSSGQSFTATYGGRTLTQAIVQNSNRWQTWIGYLKESDITSRTGDTVAVTVAGTHTHVRGYIASYAGADQTTPITDANGRYLLYLNYLTIGGPLDVNAGGYAVYGWSGEPGVSRNSDTEGYVENTDVNEPLAMNSGVASKAFTTAGTTNPSVTWSGITRASVSFVTINPASTYPPPSTTGISPNDKTVGDADFTLTVYGANFVDGVSVVRLDGVDRTTTFVSSTRLTATIPASDLAAPGDKSVTVFTPAPGGGASNAQVLTVRITPAITWANPADIVYGTPLSDAQLCATAPVPGAFVYRPGLGDLLSPGTGQTLHVDFAPTDTAFYSQASADVTINVNKAALTITADSLAKPYGSTHTFSGTGFSADGLLNGDTVTGVTLTSAGAAADATVDGGPYPIVASAALGTGLQDYGISYVDGALTVTKASTGLVLTHSTGWSTEGRPVTFTAAVKETGATGTVTFQDGETALGSSMLSDGTASCTTSTLPVGSHSITAIYSGDANFTGSTSSAVDLEVGTAPGFSWATIGWIAAAVLLVFLFLLLAVLRRRRRQPSGASTTAQAAGVAAGDIVASAMALPTVENVGTYSIQLERELERSLKKVEESMEGAIEAICRTVESKDPYVATHQKRVSQLACTIAKEMGLPAWQIDGIRVAGLLHDIGKVTVPTEILSKPGKLSAMEFSLIKDHPRAGFEILKNVHFDWPVARIVAQHHERLDGSGYPHGLSGADILLEARILAVADVVEAMCTDRPYRPALKMEDALAELDRGDGTLYDPEVVRACKKVLNERGFKVELAGDSAGSGGRHP